MWRKVLLLVGVLVLALATIGSALAAPGPKEDKAKGPPEGVPAVAGQAAAGAKVANANGAPGGAFQAVIKTPGTVNWVVETSKYEGELTVRVEDARIQWPGRKNATLDSFAQGDHVVIQLANKPNGNTSGFVARRVHLIPGNRFLHVTGELIASGDNTVAVRNGAGETIQFNVENGTTVKHGPQLTTLQAFGGTGKLNDDWLNKIVTVVARDSSKVATAIVLHGAQTGQEAAVDNDDDDQAEDQGKALGKGKSQAPGQLKDKPDDDDDDDDEDDD